MWYIELSSADSVDSESAYKVVENSFADISDASTNNVGTTVFLSGCIADGPEI